MLHASRCRSSAPRRCASGPAVGPAQSHPLHHLYPCPAAALRSGEMSDAGLGLLPAGLCGANPLSRTPGSLATRALSRYLRVRQRSGRVPRSRHPSPPFRPRWPACQQGGRDIGSAAFGLAGNVASRGQRGRTPPPPPPPETSPPKRMCRVQQKFLKSDNI